MAANTSSDLHHLDLPAGASVVYATHGAKVDGGKRLTLAAHDAAIWVDRS